MLYSKQVARVRSRWREWRWPAWKKRRHSLAQRRFRKGSVQDGRGTPRGECYEVAWQSQNNLIALVFLSDCFIALCTLGLASVALSAILPGGHLGRTLRTPSVKWAMLFMPMSCETRTVRILVHCCTSMLALVCTTTNLCLSYLHYADLETLTSRAFQRMGHCGV